MLKSNLQDPRRNAAPAASNQSQRGRGERSDDALLEIVHGCQRSHRSSQQRLYEACHERLFRLLVRMVGSQDAPDLLQQVFLQAFRKIGQFSGDSHFGTWLYRLAINECLQFRRRSSRVQFESSSEEPVDRCSPHARRIQQQELLELALAQLAPNLRAIFVLREVEGLTYRDIAETLGIKEGTVGSRLNQARAELRMHLDKLGWNCEP